MRSRTLLRLVGGGSRRWRADLEAEAQPHARAPVASTGSDHRAPNQRSNPPGRWHLRFCRAPPLGSDWCCSASPCSPAWGRHSAIKDSEDTKDRRDRSAKPRFWPPVRLACPGIPVPPFTPKSVVAASAASKDCDIPRNACLTANRSDFVKSAKYRIGRPAGAVTAAARTRRQNAARSRPHPQTQAWPPGGAGTGSPHGRPPRGCRPAV